LTVVTLCAQLTRDLFAVAKFLVCDFFTILKSLGGKRTEASARLVGFIFNWL